MDSSQATIALPADPDLAWLKANAARVESLGKKGDVILDLDAVRHLRPPLLYWMIALKRSCEASGYGLHLQQVHPAVEPVLRSLPDLPVPELPETASENSLLLRLGSAGEKVLNDLVHMAHLFAECLYGATVGRRLWRGQRLSGDVWIQMQRLGSSALPIVSGLSFLVGLTLAFQSATQLAPFGATLYLVRGTVFATLSEIAPLMSAIILAGRSGASITAEISTMAVGEEIKALRSMGVSPVPFLVLPRMEALTVTVPLLTACAALAAIAACLVVALMVAGLPWSLFVSELTGAMSLYLVFQCMVKSLAFAWIIGLVASSRGLSARGGAQSVGLATTDCVVTAIAGIILADAAFSFVFYS